ncbi:MAG: hypothetical protein U5K84_06010 [Alkalibacterium sp.]|nr:hypothetical protein [Alkalibacterium sp.]
MVDLLASCDKVMLPKITQNAPIAKTRTPSQTLPPVACNISSDLKNMPDPMLIPTIIETAVLNP